MACSKLHLNDVVVYNCIMNDGGVLISKVFFANQHVHVHCIHNNENFTDKMPEGFQWPGLSSQRWR